jgi:hypothetical protein
MARIDSKSGGRNSNFFEYVEPIALGIFQKRLGYRFGYFVSVF